VIETFVIFSYFSASCISTKIEDSLWFIGTLKIKELPNILLRTEPGKRLLIKSATIRTPFSTLTCSPK